MRFYYFRIADLFFELRSPKKLAILPCMEPFRIEFVRKPDLIYKIVCNQLKFDVKRVVSKGDFSVVQDRERFIRIKYVAIDKQIYPIFLSPDKHKNTYMLCLPNDYMDANAVLFDKMQLWSFLAPEEGILAYQGFILHSSIIEWNGKAILFTAPSGTGKSTQAELWKKYAGADVYNGDRTIVRKINNVYYGFGSPFAGSSGIYRNKSAPVRAIVVLTQAENNQIYRLYGKQAFLPLFRETLMNTWNPAYMESMTDLLMDTITNVPIYHLACRPDRDAVRLVKETLFQ